MCVKINYLAQDRSDMLFAAKEMARWMFQPNTLGVGRWHQGVRSVLVGQAKNGAEIRGATSS